MQKVTKLPVPNYPPPPAPEKRSSEAYLRLDHIGKSFTRGEKTSEVLKDVNLSINKGEFVAIIGHSGCGKSTLLNLIAGLTQVTTGAVLLENREVNAPGPERAVVFQNHSLLPWLTVYDNVSLAVNKVFSGKKSRAERHDWVMHNLDLVQMTHAKDKRPSEVSGGMKQRVGIARALVDGAQDPAARRALRRARCADARPPPGQHDGNSRAPWQYDADDNA